MINDVFSLASAGTVDYSVALSMLSYLKKEESLAPWKTASGVIKKLTSLLIDTDSYPHLRKVRITIAVLNLVTWMYGGNLRIISVRAFPCG